MTRADKIIEGFKLGSLGAGRPHAVSSPISSPLDIDLDPEKKERRKLFPPTEVKEGTYVNPVIPKFELPYIYWQDHGIDRLKYCFAVYFQKESGEKSPRFTWYLAAGPSLEVGLTAVTPQEPKPMFFMRNADWIAIAAMRTHTFETIIKKFGKRVPGIKSRGIDRLLLDYGIYLTEMKALHGVEEFKGWKTNKKVQLGLF
jgi:hypothetical protein